MAQEVDRLVRLVDEYRSRCLWFLRSERGTIVTRLTVPRSVVTVSGS